MSPTTLATAMPTTIGRYQVSELLGQGTMGVVYRARDPLLGRIVAVKVMQSRRETAETDLRKCRESFLREARAAAKLDHPHIVRVFDVGESEDGAPFLVMEHMAGPSLERVMEEFQLDSDQILRLLEQLVSAVDTANAAGIVHRDIKPANILFTEDGEIAKIADFGIARFVDSAATQDVSRMATPIYMSPEQASGRRVDGRADLFSLGVLCYHLFARRPPFQGEDPVALAYQVVHATHTPLSQLVPGLPTRLDPVVDRILAKDPTDRYPNGREFLDALRYAISGVTETAVSAPRPRGSRGAESPPQPFEAPAAEVRPTVSTPEAARLAQAEQPAASPQSRAGTSAQGRVEATVTAKASTPAVDAPAQKVARTPPIQPSPVPHSSPTKGRRLPLWLGGLALSVIGLVWLVLPSSDKSGLAAPPASEPPAAAGTPISASPIPIVAPPSAEDLAPAPVVATAPTTELVQVPRKTPRRPPSAAVPARTASPTPAAAATAVELPPPAQVEPPSRPPAPVMATGDLVVRLRHRIGGGELKLLVDGKPAIAGDFSKKKLDLVKVSAWEPVPLAAGVHTLTATVTSTKGKSYVLEPVTVEVPSDRKATVTLGIKKGRLVMLDSETDLDDDQE